MTIPDTCRPALTRLPLTVALVLACVRPATAHEGPPFPILMDQPAGGYLVSVWADPDIGEAQFFIIIETPEGTIPTNPPEVSLWVEPVNGRLERVPYEAVRESLTSQMQFAAEPYFDQRDQWTVGIEVAPPSGDPEVLTTEVESTPPGYGLWDLAIYLFPFLLLGGFWAYAMLRRVHLVRAYHAQQPTETQQEHQTAVTVSKDEA